MGTADVIVEAEPLWQQLLVSFSGTAGALVIAWLAYKWTRRDEAARLAAQMSNDRQLAFEQRRLAEADAERAAEHQRRARQVAGLPEACSEIVVILTKSTWDLRFHPAYDDAAKDSLLSVAMQKCANLLLRTNRLQGHADVGERIARVDSLARAYLMAVRSSQAGEPDVQAANGAMVQLLNRLARTVVEWEFTGVLQDWPDWDKKRARVLDPLA
jgi:hypothetical protein